MVRFYRYIIYKLYNWRRNKKDDIPIATVIFMLTITHSFYILTIYALSRIVFDYENYLVGNKYLNILFFFVFSLINYFIFYSDKKWDKYIDEFKDEGNIKSRRGWVFVLLYLFGGILMFFSILPLLFSES